MLDCFRILIQTLSNLTGNSPGKSFTAFAGWLMVKKPFLLLLDILSACVMSSRKEQQKGVADRKEETALLDVLRE